MARTWFRRWMDKLFAAPRPLRTRRSSLCLEVLEDRTVPAAFTAGNVVIYRIGTGSGSLVNTGNDVFLDEYNPSGTLVQSIALPTTASGAQKQLIASGTATSEGLLSLSGNGQFLLLTGYGRDLGGVGSLSSTASAAVPRVVGVVGANGSVDTSTALTDYSSGNNPRSATSTDGTTIWVAGGTGGVRTTTVGSTTSTDVSTTVANLRQIGIFNSQLYVSTGSGSAVRVGTVGSGTPTSSGQTIANLPGFATSGSPYAFFFADLDAGVSGVDTLYVAAEDAGALQKFSLVGGNWTSNGVVGVDADDYRGVTGFVSGSTVTLFATRKGGSTAAGGGELVTLQDTSGYNASFSGTPTVLATATANTAFRGISVAPVAAAGSPTVSSIVRAASNPTNASSVNYTVTFSQAVTGVNTADFTLTTSGVSGASVSGVSGSGTTYTVSVNTGSGNGTIRLDVTDDDSIVNGSSVPLGGSGSGNGNFTSGEVYTIDKTAPTVSSVVRAGTNPSNASSVNYTVTFSESVTGVNAGDFTLTTSGVSGASVGSISGSGTTYTVSVNTGSGNGTIRLDVVDDDSVVDAATNTLNGGFTSGEVYTIDKTAPTVVSVVRASTSPTAATSVNYTVTFSESVTGVNAADFTLTVSGITGAAVSGVSGSGTTYTVSVNTGSGDGTLRLNVADDDSIVDGASNTLNGGFTSGEVYTIDKTAPSVVSVVRAGANPTNASSVNYTVTFSESVTGVNSADFTLTTTGVSGASIGSVSGSGSTYTVSVNTGSGNGTIRLDVVDDDTIQDILSNTLSGGFTSGEVYTIDKTAPSVVSVVRASANPTNASSVNYTVTFSESVTGVNAADFTLTTTGVSGASVSGVSGSGATYTVSVNTGSGNGTIRLDVVDDDSILDLDTNPLNGGFTTGEVYTIDKTAPSVVSVVRADANPTNASSVSYTVTFSESVAGVNSADFTLTTTGVTGASISSVSGSGTTYTVSVNTGSGDGTIRLDVVDDDTILDAATNSLGGGFTTGEVYTLDRTVPSVVFVVRDDANPTNASSVNYTVTFSENVTGVNSGDFTLTTTGVSGASISGVSGSGTTYTVTVNTGSGDGTIRLDVSDDDSIVDASSNTLSGGFTTGEVYTLDRTAPSVVSVVRADANPTNASSVSYTVTFSESVTGVGVGDFSLTTSGVTGASVSGVSGSGTTYTVSVNTGSGDGTLRLNVADDDTIADAATNSLGGGFTTGEVYTLDRTVPSVVSVVRADANPTNASSVSYTVTFSESVTGVNSADFTLTTTGVTGASISSVSGSGTTYTVSVNTGSGDGTIRLDVVDDDTILDAVTNALSGGFTAGEVYTIDKSAPSVVSVVRADANPTNASSVNYTVTFSESVTGVNAADFTLTTTGVTGTSISGVSGSGTTYTVSVNTGSGSGTIRLDVVDDDTIVDAAINSLNGGFTTGEVYTLDRSAPSVVSVVRADTNPTNAGSVSYTVTFSESVTGVNSADFTLTTAGLSGTSVSGVSGSGTTYTVTVSTGTGSGTLRLDVLDDDTIVDAVSNPLNSGFTAGEVYTIDRTVPSVVSVVRADANPTNASSVNYTVTFSESVTGVDSSDFSLTTTGVTGTSISGVSGSGTTYTVSVNTGSGDGTIRLDVVDDDTILDAVTNALSGGFTAGEVYTIDKSAPSVVSVVRADANPTNASSVSYTVTFSESVTGVNAGDFTLTTTGVTGTSISGVSGSGTTYTVSVNTGSGSGTIRLNVVDDDTIVDAAINSLNGGFTTAEIYTIDRSAPSVVSVVRASPNPTNAASVNYTVTFSESVTGVNASDFTLTTTGVTGTSISGVSGSGTTYTVSVNTGSGSGTIRLDVVDDDTILDAVSNSLNGGFTSGEVYTLDRTAPSVVSVVRASGNPTNASSVNYTVTFSESVTGVNAADFTLTTTGVTGTSISGVSGSGTTYTVSVNTGSGSGTIRLNVVDDDTIVDAVSNPLNGGFTTGEVYTIDRTAPSVVSVVRANPSPTNASSVAYTVTFSESVTGLNASDFTLTTTGLSGSSVGSVSGSGTTYTVSVNTGSGTGTLRLDVLDDDTIVDAVSNPLNGGFTAGEVYTIDRTAPSVVSVVRASPNPTNASSVNFTVTFSESVTGVDSADFTLTTTGVTGTSITGISGSGTTYTVTVTTGSGDGTIRLDVVDNDTISDGAANTLSGGFTAGEVYTVDRGAPNVVSVVRASANPTNASSVAFTVTFSESVTGVNTGDFSLTTSGITGASMGGVSGGGSTYTVTINTGSGSGTLRLNVLDDDTVVDASGNGLLGPFTSGEVYTIDKTAPSVVSVVRASANPTNASSVNYTVTFSESVTGVNVSDFTLTTTGVSGASVGSVSGSGTTYTVSVNTGSGNGTLRLDVIDDDTIVDALSNTLSGPFSAGEVYTLDRTAPSIVSVVRASANPTNASSVNYTVTFSESVTGVNAADFSLTPSGVTGASVSSVSGSGATYTVSVNTGSGSGTLRLNVLDDDTIVDGLGTSLSGGFTSGEVYTIDKTAPSVVSVVRASANPTNAASVNYTVTFSENVVGVDTGDFSVTTSGMLGATVSSVSGSGSVYTVAVAAGTGQGTLRLDVVDNGSIDDAVGNGLTGGFTAGESYTLDRVAPAVVSVVRNDVNPTNAASVSYTVTFSESVTGVDTTDFSLTTTGVSGASLGSVSGSGTTYTVSVNTGNGNGTLRLDVVDNDSIADSFSNTLNSGFVSGEVYTINKSAPSVVSVVRASVNPSNASSVTYTVTFNEDVTGVDVGDFTLSTSGLSGASVSSVSGSGNVYTVAVNTGVGNGTLRLDVLDNDSIQNNMSNSLLAGFTTGEVYTFDRTAPSVISVVRAGVTPTTAATVDYTVTFTEAVTGVDLTDFQLTSTVTGAVVAGVSGSGNVYTVTVNTGAGDGSVRLEVIDNDTIADGVGNTLTGGFSAGDTYVIERAMPQVVGIVPADPTLTGAASVNYTVTFSEAVSGVDASDFRTTFTNSLQGTIIAVVPVSANVYTVTVGNLTGSGQVSLRLRDNDSIQDGLGNQLGGAGLRNGDAQGAAYTVKRGRLKVLSLAPVNGSPVVLDGTDVVVFRVLFNSAVNNVSANAFVGLGAGRNIVSVNQVSPTTVEVGVRVVGTLGNVGLKVRINGGLIDGLGRTLSASVFSPLFPFAVRA